MNRRLFLKRCLAGCGAIGFGGAAGREFLFGEQDPEMGVGFRNDAPATLDAFSRPAAWAQARGELVECRLCPHACILGENDRGFCRTRVVKGGKLHTVAYGNLCAAAVDPIEKKPLYHYLPRTPILSVAMGGCNLRCLNCQNSDISQARPADVQRDEALPEQLVDLAAAKGVRALAYTYSEPLVSFEYVRDASARAREKGIKNVLVTAGYVNPAPLRELCRTIDAVTLDVKAFRDRFYREVSGARLSPVLSALEVIRQEGLWLEVSFLMVPTLSDDPKEIGAFAAWVAKALGPGTPLHILRFHAAYRLKHLPRTPEDALDVARQRALEAGLEHVYVGNVPGSEANHTFCPSCGRKLIERNGFVVERMDLLAGGRCPCGKVLSGVWS